MDISHLNIQQQLAVCLTEGIARVIAGANTGKILQILFVENATIYNVAALTKFPKPEQRLCIETESITFVFSIFPFRFYADNVM